MATLDEGVQAIQEEDTIVGGLEAAVNAVLAEIKNGGLTPEAQVKVDAIVTGITSDKARLKTMADALVAGTPAASVPVDQPPTP